MPREPRGVREYSTNEIVVEWQPRLCFHSHNCIRALPKVFDAERRPSTAGRPPRRPRRTSSCPGTNDLAESTI